MDITDPSQSIPASSDESSLVTATFPGSGMYAIAACMLRLKDISVTDRDLALQMELPYLWASEDGQYKCGTALNSPEWMNLAVRPYGWQMVRREIPKADLWQYLVNHTPAAVPFADMQPRLQLRYYVIPKITKLRAQIIAMRMPGTPDMEERGAYSLTRSEILRRVPENEPIPVFTLEKAKPATFDLKPYLYHSLNVVNAYHQAVEELWHTKLRRDAFDEQAIPLFQPLLQNARIMARISGDWAMEACIDDLRYCMWQYVYGRYYYKKLADHLDDDLLNESLWHVIRHIEERLDELECPGQYPQQDESMVYEQSPSELNPYDFDDPY